jgi:ABC-type uncharacterized transport system ATPase subunit
MADVIHRGQLTLTRLTKRYSSATAVDAIDLVVERGEFLTLLGPSGSGKTTTLVRDLLDWNFGASLGVFLLTVVGTLFVLFSTLFGLERLTGDSRA